MVTIADAVRDRATFRTGFADEAVEAAKQWLADERAQGTLLGAESLWTEAYHVYAGAREGLREDERAAAWACIAATLVFDTGKVPLNQRTAARDACEMLIDNPSLPFVEKARRLQSLADRHNVDPWKVRALLAPGVGCPWLFPRAVWSEDVVGQAVEAILAPFDWGPGLVLDGPWVEANAIDRPLVEFLDGLRSAAPEGSVLSRAVDAVRSFVAATEQEHKDVGVVETHSFIGALAAHGLAEPEIEEWQGRLLALREAVVLLHTFALYRRAERLVRGAEQIRDSEPRVARELLEKAANIYKRMAVAQLYAERLLDRHRQVVRMGEELSAEHGLADDRPDHVMLISTYQSPGDLNRLLLSVGHELMGYAYGKQVRLVVCDESKGQARRDNEAVYAEAARSGLNLSVWDTDRRAAFLDRLSGEIFPDGSFRVEDLAGKEKPGEKGVPYGRLRNFLRLAGLVEIREHGLDEPVLTWLDQDNELGALVLTRDGTLAKRHVFDYFGQKADIFSDRAIKVGGGGYTNDALEGVEKFWVAWGILHTALGLAEQHEPQEPAVLSPAADITKFRPWDQADTLERLPREDEDVETMSDQFLLLLNTLIGTFRGKYDNQVQIYHPWSYGYVVPGEERLLEEMRAFAGMPGGNTSFRTEVAASPIPFITVCGRGEDIFHLWQLEGVHGPGSIRLTHTPALHTRNVKAGRGDLMAEIVNSYNGRIFREPPYLWAALREFFDKGPGAPLPGPDIEAETDERIRGLQDEAKANIGAVSAFAAEIEPYLDDSGGFWWVSRAEEDPRCATLLSTLRNLVREFKDVERHHRKADEQLLGLDEVKDLTAEFVAAYPHWETVVEHVSGISQAGARELSGLAGAGPGEGYGSGLRSESHTTPRFEAEATVEPAVGVEPVDDPPWHEVLTASLLLFRRYERGRAIDDSWVEWDQRVARLRALYEHHAAQVDDVPPFVWPTLYRDALFVPHSRPYRAMTELLSESDVDVSQVAEQFGVDERLLRPAVGDVSPSRG